MNYYATSNVMEAIAGQIRDQLGGYVDDIVIFDGSVEQAVSDHFEQPSKSRLKGVIMLTLSEDVPDSLSGAGLPIRNGLMVDILVLVRSDGKSRYTKDRERLYGLSDALMYTTFDCPNRRQEYTDRVAANNFQFRRRAAAGGDLMAHLVRFIFKPRVP